MTTTIFITGASGFIGRAVDRAVKGGGEASVVALPRHGELEALRAQLEVRQGRAALIHLAWPNLPGGLSRASGSLAGEGWAEFLDWSVALREACEEAGIWFVGIGTGIEACAADRAADLAEPYRSYARRKSELRAALERPVGTSWVRLHYIFGPFEDPSRLVPAAIRACLDGAEIICGARHRRRHWLHVDDVASFLVGFATDPASGLWDIAGQQDVSFNELLGLIEQTVGKPLRVSGVETSTADAQLAVVAPTNLASIVPQGAGRPENLLARLKDYARWIEAGGK